MDFDAFEDFKRQQEKEFLKFQHKVLKSQIDTLVIVSYAIKNNSTKMLGQQISRMFQELRLLEEKLNETN